MNYLEKNEESKHRNDINAQNNFNFFKKVEDIIRENMDYKVHDYFNDYKTDPQGVMQCIPTITEIKYVVFSWKNAKGSYSYPISFHLEEEEFKEQFKPFCRKCKKRDIYFE